MYLWIYILITASPIMACSSVFSKPEPQVTSTPKEKIDGRTFVQPPVKVGEDKTIECSYDHYTMPFKQLVWRQYFPAVNLTFDYPATTTVKTYKFKLTVGEFDDNTILTCVDSQNQTLNYAKLSVLHSATKYSHKNEKYYDEDTSVECDCSNYSVSDEKTSRSTFRRGVISYLIQVKPNRQVHMFSHENGTKIKFTKYDNNSLLYCLCIVNETKTYYIPIYEVTRHVKEIGLLKYQEKTEGENESFSKKSYFIAGAFIGFIILAVIFIVFWKRNKSKKTASENNNEDPARITYAELDLKSVPNNRRTLKVDETPYAEIVLHENQPYLHCETRTENTESPYANC